MVEKGCCSCNDCSLGPSGVCDGIVVEVDDVEFDVVAIEGRVWLLFSKRNLDGATDRDIDFSSVNFVCLRVLSSFKFWLEWRWSTGLFL